MPRTYTIPESPLKLCNPQVSTASPGNSIAVQKRMTQRTNVGVMMAGQGASGDVFAATEQFLKVRGRIAPAP